MKEKIINLLITIKNKLKRKKWRVYLYYKNQCIKKVYINENFKLQEDLFIVNVYNKKHLFGTRKTKLVCKFWKMKSYNDINKELHCEVLLYEGREIN